MKTSNAARSHRSTALRMLAMALLLAVLLLNFVAWMQARSMTHYAPDGERTRKPEELSLPERAWTVLAGVTVPRPRIEGTPADLGLAYAEHRVEIGEGEWLEAWYVTPSDPRGLVLAFPGYAESKSSMLAQAVALTEMGYAVLLVDFRGAGGSSGDVTTLGMREARDVAAAVEYARREWPDVPVVLYGVSMGSAAVLRSVAEEGVRADALILESPFDTMLNTVRNRFSAMGLPAWPGAELVVLWGGAQHGFDGFNHNPADYARTVTVPTLVLHGEQDPRVTMEQSQSIYRQLAGQKTFVSFPGAGHESLIGSAEELWKGEVRRFLLSSVSVRGR